MSSRLHPQVNGGTNTKVQPKSLIISMLRMYANTMSPNFTGSGAGVRGKGSLYQSTCLNLFVAALAGLVVIGACALPLLAVEAPQPTVPIPPATNILARLNQAHPRLLATTEDFAQLKERIASDPQLQSWHAKLQAQAQDILGQAPSRYEIPDGLRLLATSRRVMKRVYTLALLYRLDGDQRYAERAWQELAAAAEVPGLEPAALPRHGGDDARLRHRLRLAL